MVHPQQWWYTNLTIYESSCKCQMQFNRNSSHKPGTNLSGFFFYYVCVLLHGIKMALILVLEKKRKKIISSCKIFGGCLKL